MKRKTSKKITDSDYESDGDFESDLPDYLPNPALDGWSEIEDGCYRKIIPPCEYY